MTGLQHSQIGLRQRQKSSNLSEDKPSEKVEGFAYQHGTGILTIAELLSMLLLVFGGCCSNVWSFEQLLRKSAHVGSAITFGQMLFITCQSLPQFLILQKCSSVVPLPVPVLRSRYVPLSSWALQVLVMTSGALLNNWAFAYDVPLTLQIVFRSSGLPVSMLFGYVFDKRRFSAIQIASVMLVTIGVIWATVSRPISAASMSNADGSRYYVGVAMLTTSLLLTGTLGLLQERTYGRYGPYWKEGVFYTHFLSLPVFLFLVKDIVRGFCLLADSPGSIGGISSAYLFLPINLLTQLICVSGVNQLTSRVSSVSANLVLTTRKAMSLCLSVWLFHSGWNMGLFTGALMVFSGSVLYTVVTSRRSTKQS